MDIFGGIYAFGTLKKRKLTLLCNNSFKIKNTKSRCRDIYAIHYTHIKRTNTFIKKLTEIHTNPFEVTNWILSNLKAKKS